jgi:hypothetical protein
VIGVTSASLASFGRRPYRRRSCCRARLPPGKTPDHPPQQVRRQRGSGLIGYRGSIDCRVLTVSHKPIMIAAAAPLRGPLTHANNPTVTNYCCRICADSVALAERLVARHKQIGSPCYRCI